MTVEIDVKIKDILTDSKNLSQRYGGDGVSANHIVYIYLEKDEKIERAFTRSVISLENFKNDLKASFSNFKLKKNEKYISNEVKNAVSYCTYAKDIKEIDEFLLLKEILKSHTVKKLLKRNHSTPEEVLTEIEEIFSDKIIDYSYIQNIKSQGEKSDTTNDSLSKNKSLKNLNKSKKTSKMIGRNEEIQKIIQILQRKTKNSIILIGDSGVGKTTILQNLAMKIEEKDVPDFLIGKTIFELKMSELISGSALQGALEKKVNELIDEIKKHNGGAIIVIDKIQNILSGEKQTNRIGIMELLEPHLDSGEIICIGTTDKKGYRDIEENVSINRIFQKVFINQPTQLETISIMRGLKSKLEHHYDIKIDDEAIISAVKLSERYLPTKSFPDKAIDILDEAASIVRISLDYEPRRIIEVKNKISEKTLEKETLPLDDNESSIEVENIEKEIIELNNNLKTLEELLIKDKEIIKRQDVLIEKIKIESNEEIKSECIKELEELLQKEFKILKTKVTKNEILEILAQKTNIPLDKVFEDDNQKLLKLEERLKSNVIGQDNAIKYISNSLKISQTGLSDPEKPIGSFLFLGSTGVGKTELCKQLAVEMFNDKKNLIRFDMSEFMEKHSLAQLIGSPVGYEGSKQGGKLTESIKNNPYSIVLLDEIEKAHPDILNILLQILDDGHLSDARGELINFKNTIIIMTSNIGSQHIKDRMSDRLRRKVINELEKQMKPELINRIDEKIIFDRLDFEAMKKICKISLNKLSKRLIEKGIKIEFTQETISYLAAISNDSKYGARPLNRKIKELVENPISNEILQGEIKKNDNISFILNRNGYKIIKNN